MANRGNNFNSNRSQNHYQNGYPIHQQMNVTAPHESRISHGMSQNSREVTSPFPKNSPMSTLDKSRTFNGKQNCGGQRNSYTDISQSETPLYNISSEVWDRAANSRLTPTAGEFVPGSIYQPHNPQTQGGMQSNHTQLERNSCSDQTSMRRTELHGASGISKPVMNYHQRKYPEKRENYYHNGNNRRQFSVEQSKAEGRQKLLQEAAGLLPQNKSSSSSKSNPQTQGGMQSNHTQLERNSCSDQASVRRTELHGEFGNSKPVMNYHQRKYPEKRENYYYNGNNRRQFSVEQSKAEGRQKLLQEAAGLLPLPQNESSSSSEINCPNTSIDSTSRWQPRNSTQSFKHNYKSASSKTFSRSTKSLNPNHQMQGQSPSKKTSSLSSSKTNRHKTCDDAASQRDSLINQLNRGTLECLVCCEQVRQTDYTWSCQNCFHVLHLRCIVKWANTSKADNGWRCPACQNVTVRTPQDYYCFCGKSRNPEWTRTDTAHSCGEVCNRLKVLASEHYSCVHHCTLLCHPGPCPPCVALVTRMCGCGKTSQNVQCGQTQPLVCQDKCDKPLECGLHNCGNKCHLDNCKPCQITIKQVCYCGKNDREVKCDGNNQEDWKFSCEKMCEKKLTCGEHLCEQLCHEGPCDSCPRDPTRVSHCHCGKMPLSLSQLRLSCRDPIPSCGQNCGRQMLCGQPNNPHECKAICHENTCPPCDRTTLVRCRCGYMDQEIPCNELTSKSGDVTCKKKCTKKRSCGKHKCNQMCCIDIDHVCPLLCNHMLSCGQHRCEQLCHRGHCQPCLQSSFEELFCECGSSVLLPPIPCGTKPPLCSKPCTRRHGCDHEVLHPCHSYPNCPPCSVLTTKHCHGKHELRKAVPCHMKEFSCGLPCGRELSCGRHKCVLPCHSGDCASTCKQPCTKPRELCGHPCSAPCHQGDCVDAPCKKNVVVTCECGHRSMSRPCYENNSEYQRIATSLLASKMADVQLGRSVNLADMQGPRKIAIKTLECTEECRVVERNRRLAIGLQIRNPDLSAKLTPQYSEFMRGWAKKDQRFCQLVHDKLTELVKLAKESKQKSRSYSFETMNRDKRQFVHEYCAHFGCESVAYDAEPKRNVVATAQRDKAWLPSYSLLEVVQREMGQRKVPLPNLNCSSQKSSTQSNVLPVRLVPKTVPTAASDNNQIDYFDFDGP